MRVCEREKGLKDFFLCLLVPEFHNIICHLILICLPSFSKNALVALYTVCTTMNPTPDTVVSLCELHIVFAFAKVTNFMPFFLFLGRRSHRFLLCHGTEAKATEKKNTPKKLTALKGTSVVAHGQWEGERTKEEVRWGCAGRGRGEDEDRTECVWRGGTM